MGVVFAQETAYAKEMRRWESTHTTYGPPGRPYVFQEFPKRLYRAARTEKQGIQIVEGLTANDETEQRNLQSRGFHLGQDAAIAAIEREQTLHGTLAAEREWEIQHGKLSDKATAEVRAAEASHGATHLPVMPETPIRRGRPKKAVQEGA